MRRGRPLRLNLARDMPHRNLGALRLGAESFIRLRRKPRTLPVDECVSGICADPEPRYRCFGGFRHQRITLRSLGVGGYLMEVLRGLPVGLHEGRFEDEDGY